MGGLLAISLTASFTDKKKGNLAGYSALILYVMLPLALSLILGHVILSFLGGFDFLMVGFAANLYNTMMGVYATIDTVFILIFAGFFTLLLYNGFRVDMHPILGVFGLFGLGGLVIVTGAVSSMFTEFIGVDIIGQSANSFPLIVTFFENIEITTAALGVLMIIIMVGGRRRLA